MTTLDGVTIRYSIPNFDLNLFHFDQDDHFDVLRSYLINLIRQFVGSACKGRPKSGRGFVQVYARNDVRLARNVGTILTNDQMP